MKVIIVGGGKVGYYLIRTLIEHKHEPTVIEINREVSARIADEMDIPVILGDATNYETLKVAGASEADAFISVTGSDECNLISCQLAKKEFGVKKTVAKSNNPKNVSVIKALGIDVVINSTDSIASLIEREVDTARIKQLLQLNQGDISLFVVEIPQDYVYDGKMIMDLEFSSIFNIVSITRGDSLIIPRGQSMLKSGDRLLIISESNAIKEIKSVMKIKD
ncbi:MAG: TrkA family potassium uptake protein [Oscillospiraceae bacterium]|nr:TrkA family potassium uptake protein [Oscillospiraceae bacterium]